MEVKPDRDFGDYWGKFFMYLTLMFIGLKLTGHITWSWWIVLSPMLAPIGVLIIFIILAGVFGSS